MAFTSDPLLIFLTSRRADFRRIASRTCGEHTVEDVCAESWLIAQEISRKRGLPIDFLNVDDQELVLSWLHCKLVRYADKSVRFAVKLDKDWDAQDPESASNALARLLTAPEQFDPLVRLLDEEEKFDPLALIQHSYSQASAYVILLHRFSWDLESLAEHLRLLTTTVRSKVIASGVHMKVQPSLFDRIHVIERDFLPRISRRIPCVHQIASGQVQLGWKFKDRAQFSRVRARSVSRPEP
ncbi:hypothetical protein BKP43_47650 [Variovorax boronicumulans]|uniref:hypothetical protein n=1 Tax=Variovorax boronicumulans TaxID=436515 RepID=UPI00117D3092|nr:hypothetical protein [Variovorax boronicumulans]PBI85493.1 hypothetical protein BKP43_47650 [Variovorax boronicumulans]